MNDILFDTPAEDEILSCPEHTAEPVPVSTEPEIQEVLPTGELPELPIADPPAPQKGRLWPPLLALVIIFAVGLAVFLMFGTVSDPDMPWFTLRGGTLYFDESLYSGSAELTVPATISGKRVTAISDGCFAYCESLTTIYLPEGIKTIGDSAFANNASLRGVKLPDGVESIGSGIFANCPELEAVYIPLSVTDVGRQTFVGCGDLRHIFYPGPVERWQDLGFGELPENALIYCSDGTYSQSKTAP